MVHKDLFELLLDEDWLFLYKTWRISPLPPVWETCYIWALHIHPPLSLCLSLRCRVNISLSTAWCFSIHSLSNCKCPLLSSTQGIYYLHYSYLSNVYLCTSDDNVHWSITMAGSIVTLDFPMLHDYEANQPSGKLLTWLQDNSNLPDTNLPKNVPSINIVNLKKNLELRLLEILGKLIDHTSYVYVSDHNLWTPWAISLKFWLANSLYDF